jgi:hypothetical protein
MLEPKKYIWRFFHTHHNNNNNSDNIIWQLDTPKNTFLAILEKVRQLAKFT